MERASSGEVREAFSGACIKWSILWSMHQVEHSVERASSGAFSGACIKWSIHWSVHQVEHSVERASSGAFSGACIKWSIQWSVHQVEHSVEHASSGAFRRAGLQSHIDLLLCQLHQFSTSRGSSCRRSSWGSPWDLGEGSGPAPVTSSSSPGAAAGASSSRGPSSTDRGALLGPLKCEIETPKISYCED